MMESLSVEVVLVVVVVVVVIVVHCLDDVKSGTQIYVLNRPSALCV